MISEEGAGRFDVMAAPSPVNVERLAQLLAAGALRVAVQRSFPLEQAAEALRALTTAHTRGKLGMTLA